MIIKIEMILVDGNALGGNRPAFKNTFDGVIFR